jgi:hypothetical protein
MPDQVVWWSDTQGVNASTDELHQEPGDLTIAQNATIMRDGIRGALAKRRGLRRLNASACAGAILAIANITFTDPSPSVVLTDELLGLLTDEAYLFLTE